MARNPLNRVWEPLKKTREHSATGPHAVCRVAIEYCGCLCAACWDRKLKDAEKRHR